MTRHAPAAIARRERSRSAHRASAAATKRGTHATRIASRCTSRAFRARACTDSVDTRWWRADSVTCARIILRDSSDTFSRTSLRIPSGTCRSDRRIGKAGRRSREGRSMDRRLMGGMAQATIHPAPPGSAKQPRHHGGREVGSVARRGSIARIAHSGACPGTSASDERHGIRARAAAPSEAAVPRRPAQAASNHRNARRIRSS